MKRIKRELKMADEDIEEIDQQEEMRQRLIRWHRLHVIGESTGAKMINPPKKSKHSEHSTHPDNTMKNTRISPKAESLFSESRKEVFLESLQESMHTHALMKDRAEKLAEHLGISVGEAIQQLKAHLVQKTHEHKQSSLKESLDMLQEYMEEIDHLLKHHPDMPEHHKTLLHRAKSAMKLASITAGKGDSKESEKLINHAAEHYHKVVHSLGVRPKPKGQEEAETGERKQVVHNKMYATK